MWEEAVRVAVVGFSVVAAGLVMLAAGVKIMSLFCGLIEKRKTKPHSRLGSN